MKLKPFLAILLIPTISQAAQISSYEVKPAQIQAAVMTPLSVIAHFDDNSSQDQTSQFSFSYLGSNPSGKEVTIVSFGGHFSIFGNVVGQNYLIQAVNKTNSAITASVSLSVTAGSASRFSLLSGNNQSASVGSPLPSPLVVKVVDKVGNPVPNYLVNWSVSSGSGALSSSSSFSDANGAASVSYTAGITWGTDTISASASTGSNQTSVSFSENISPPDSAPAQLAFSVTPNTLESGNSLFSTQPKVELRSSSNVLAVNDSISVSVDAYKNSSCTVLAAGILSGIKNVKTSGGVATFADLQYSQPETIYLKATSGMLKSACSRYIRLNSKSLGPSKLVFIQQPTKGVQNRNLFISPRVAVLDNLNKTVQTAVNSVTVSAYTDSACQTLALDSLTGATTLNADEGFATFNNVTYSGSGTVYLKAVSGSLTPACSSVIQIPPGNKLAFFGPYSTTGIVNQTPALPPVIQAENSQGNSISASGSVKAVPFSDRGCLTSPILGTNFNASFGSSGRAAFSQIASPAAISVYLKFSSPGFSSVCSDQITFSNPVVVCSIAGQVSTPTGCQCPSGQVVGATGCQAQNPIPTCPTDPNASPTKSMTYDRTTGCVSPPKCPVGDTVVIGVPSNMCSEPANCPPSNLGVNLAMDPLTCSLGGKPTCLSSGNSPIQLNGSVFCPASNTNSCPATGALVSSVLVPPAKNPVIECVAQPTCPAGYSFIQNQDCVLWTGGAAGEFACPPSVGFNLSLTACSDGSPFKCQSGTTFSITSGKPLCSVSCPSPLVADPIGKNCISPAVACSSFTTPASCLSAPGCSIDTSGPIPACVTTPTCSSKSNPASCQLMNGCSWSPATLSCSNSSPTPSPTPSSSPGTVSACRNSIFTPASPGIPPLPPRASSCSDNLPPSCPPNIPVMNSQTGVCSSPSSPPPSVGLGASVCPLGTTFNQTTCSDGSLAASCTQQPGQTIAPDPIGICAVVNPTPTPTPSTASCPVWQTVSPITKSCVNICGPGQLFDEGTSKCIDQSFCPNPDPTLTFCPSLTQSCSTNKDPISCSVQSGCAWDPTMLACNTAAPGCSTNKDPMSCSMQSGCSWDPTKLACNSSAPPTCSSNSSSATCSMIPGCSWDPTKNVCGADVPTCSLNKSSTTCSMGVGCSWDPMMLVCNTAPAGCSTKKDPMSCSMQSGCSWDPMMSVCNSSAPSVWLGGAAGASACPIGTSYSAASAGPPPTPARCSDGSSPLCQSGLVNQSGTCLIQSISCPPPLVLDPISKACK